MARNNRRRYDTRRNMYSYTWQSMPIMTNHRVPAGTAGEVYSGSLPSFAPGLGSGGAANVFKDDHVLERIRGAMAHNGYVQVAPLPTSDSWFPFSLGAVRVPVGFAAQPINMFNSAEGDDFCVRMDAVCNVSRDDAISNWHILDSKAKRRFGVGDKLTWLFSLLRPIDGAFNIEISVNARALWKLKA